MKKNKKDKEDTELDVFFYCTLIICIGFTIAFYSEYFSDRFFDFPPNQFTIFTFTTSIGLLLIFFSVAVLLIFFDII